VVAEEVQGGGTEANIGNDGSPMVDIFAIAVRQGTIYEREQKNLTEKCRNTLAATVLHSQRFYREFFHEGLWPAALLDLRGLVLWSSVGRWKGW
jgi:hypothetical protein